MIMVTIYLFILQTVLKPPNCTLFNDLTRDSTTLLKTSTVDAYKFYTNLPFSVRSKVISYATNCNLASNIQASTVDIYNNGPIPNLC